MKNRPTGKRPERIPREAAERPARALLAAVAKAFEDPAAVADFQKWQAERRKKEVTA